MKKLITVILLATASIYYSQVTNKIFIDGDSLINNKENVGVTYNSTRNEKYIIETIYHPDKSYSVKYKIYETLPLDDCILILIKSKKMGVYIIIRVHSLKKQIDIICDSNNNLIEIFGDGLKYNILGVIY